MNGWAGEFGGCVLFKWRFPLFNYILFILFRIMFCLLKVKPISSKETNEPSVEWNDVIVYRCHHRWRCSASAWSWGSLGVTMPSKPWSHSSDMLLRRLVYRNSLLYVFYDAMNTARVQLLKSEMIFLDITRGKQLFLP